MTSENLKWMVKRDDQINGPYTFSVLSQLAKLGRLKQTDLVSSNSEDWQSAAEIPDLFLEINTDNSETSSSDGKSSKRLLKDDERSGRERRIVASESKPQTYSRSASARSEKRKSSERRKPEAEEEINSRIGRARLLEAIENERKEDRFPFLAIFSLLVVIVIFGFVMRPAGQVFFADCDAAPNPNVIWDNCEFLQRDLKGSDLSLAKIRNADLNEADLENAILVKSDLSYTNLSKANLRHANLENAILKGSNLQSANLDSASLIGVDLSHADLRGATLKKAKFKNSNLDGTIWTDGRVCSKSSIGRCR